MTIKWTQLDDLIHEGEIKKAISEFQTDPSLLELNTPFGSWLHVAASAGQVEVCRFLLDAGLDINMRSGTAHSTALHRAASDGAVDVVKLLLQHGAMLDVSEPERNPLFGAIHWGHSEIAKLLLDAGIDFRVKYSGENMQNMDALAFAREWGRTDIAALLEAKLAE